MRNVFDNSILMVESVVHFLLHILMLLFELSDGICFYFLNSLLLALELLLKLLSELSLPLLSAFLLRGNSVFNYMGLLSQQF